MILELYQNIVTTDCLEMDSDPERLAEHTSCQKQSRSN